MLIVALNMIFSNFSCYQWFLTTYLDRVPFNPSPLSATYMRRWTGSALVKIMACRLNGAKPLSELVLTYCQLYHKETHFNEILFEIQIFSRKCTWKCRLEDGGHFVSASMCCNGGHILTLSRRTSWFTRSFWHMLHIPLIHMASNKHAISVMKNYNYHDFINW